MSDDYSDDDVRVALELADMDNAEEVADLTAQLSAITAERDRLLEALNHSDSRLIDTGFELREVTAERDNLGDSLRGLIAERDALLGALGRLDALDHRSPDGLIRCKLCGHMHAGAL